MSATLRATSARDLGSLTIPAGATRIGVRPVALIDDAGHVYPVAGSDVMSTTATPPEVASGARSLIVGFVALRDDDAVLH